MVRSDFMKIGYESTFVKVLHGKHENRIFFVRSFDTANQTVEVKWRGKSKITFPTSDVIVVGGHLKI